MKKNIDRSLTSLIYYFRTWIELEDVLRYQVFAELGSTLIPIQIITAVKKTVAPIPAYLFCSPMQQLSKISVSEPEQIMKNCFNMIDEFCPFKLRKGQVD